MEHSPWEANSSSDCPKIRSILWNPSSITAFTTARHLSIFWARSSQSTPPPYFLKINFNITFPSMTGSSKWPLSLRFPNQNFACMSSLPCTHHMNQPSHSWLQHPDIWWEFKQCATSTPLLPPPLRSKYLSQHSILKTSHPQCDRSSFTNTRTHTHTHKTGHIAVRITILLNGNKHTPLFLQAQFTHKMY